MSALSDRIARLVADAIAGEDVYCELQDVIREVDALCAPVGVEGLIADWRDQARRLRNEVPNLRDGTDKRFFAACDADRAADELEAALAQQPSAAPEGEKA